MTRNFCDRCGAETTGKKSSAVSGVPEADATGSGMILDSAELCQRCYREFLTWLKPTSGMKKGKRR